MGAKANASIESRLLRLEKVVFGKDKQISKPTKAESSAGPSGGVKLLISQGFFSKRRSLADVREAMAKNDFYYRTSAIQTALNRLSTRTAPLTASSEGGKKVYVRRK